MAERLQIGVVAQKTGLTVDAIRFYERERLLASPVRSEGGFRLFQDRDVQNLLFIRSAQELGFSLDEIRGMLALRDGAPKPCAQVERLLEAKLASVEEKIAVLKKLEAELRAALRECRRGLARKPSRGEDGCPVLEQIARGPRSVSGR